jgi:predicted nucleic acid-binding protein
MIGNKALLDSNVIIDASKGEISLQDIINSYDFLYTSIISYTETLGYNFKDKDEKKLIEQILASIEVIDLN